MKVDMKIEKKYLVFRDEAREILDGIKKKAGASKQASVLLDFACVDFFSRSFVDEFINSVNKLRESRIEVTFTNLKPSLEGFINTVQATKAKIQREVTAQYDTKR